MPDERFNPELVKPCGTKEVEDKLVPVVYFSDFQQLLELYRACRKANTALSRGKPQ